MMRVSLYTLGCKLNFAETSTIGRQFVERGYTVVDDNQPSDVVVLNTCSVTERTDRECRQIIRRSLRRSPGAFVIVTGCYAQLRPEQISAIDGVDLVVGSKEKFRIFDLAPEFVKRSLPQVFVSCIDDAVDFEPSYSSDVGGRTRAFLKIQDGCDYSCTFCTIPRARGESRSMEPGSLVRQAERLAEMGYREIVLTGVNVGDYGRKIGTDLFTLMRELDRVVPVNRFRVSSIEPNLLTGEMIDFVVRSGKFCNHFHIPLQSGSDGVLRRMRRRYLTSHYRSVIETIRARDERAGIGADVIVGFPGETEEEFAETCRFIGELPLSYLHVFTYSERPGTPASGYDTVVPSAVRAERSGILRSLGRTKRSLFHAAHTGRTVDVLFESESRPGFRSGWTTNYIRVESPSASIHENSIHSVTIRRSDPEICDGIPAIGPETPTAVQYTVSTERS